MKVTSNIIPLIIETVGNGTYLYHYDIAKVEQNSTTEDQDSMYEYEEVIIYGKPTSNNVTEAVITHKYPVNYQQKLVNEYNGAMMGLYDDEKKQLIISEYHSYLIDRNRLKGIVDEYFLQNE